MKTMLGCYYFPNYHTDDARNTEFHGAGWSEWEVVKQAVPRFEGHAQPRRHGAEDRCRRRCRDRCLYL